MIILSWCGKSTLTAAVFSGIYALLAFGIIIIIPRVVAIRYDCYDKDGRLYYSSRPCSDRAPPRFKDVPPPLTLGRDDDPTAVRRIDDDDDGRRGGYGYGRRSCANGGKFAGAYCLAASDCAHVRPPRGADGVLDCVRAMCCTRTTVSSTTSNVATADDLRRCTRLAQFYMGMRCARNADCNRVDRDARDRGYGIFICVNGEACCSKLNHRPENVGDGCVNGGTFIGTTCPRNDDRECERTDGTGVAVLNPSASPPICIDGVCCNVPTTSSDDFYDDDYGDDDGGDDYGEDDSDDDYGDDDDEFDDCLNGGQYLGTLCTNNRECGVLAVDDRWTAVCSDGRCCTNIQNLRGDGTPMLDQTGAEWRRGESACATTNGAVGGRYVGAKCTRPSDCGAHPTLEFRCRSGFCCEFYDARRVAGGGGRGGRRSGRRRRRYDSICDYRGYDLGYACVYDRGTSDGQCRPSRNPTLRNACIRGRCCAMQRRGTRTRFLDRSTSSSSSDDSEPLGERRYDPNDRDNGPSARSAFCYDGTPSDMECRAPDDCLPDESCVNNLCCPRQPDQRQYVCGGLPTNGACFPNGQCGNNLFCTATQLCCECRYGQPQLGVVDCRRDGGACRDGYYCNKGGFCCPRCASGNQPYGSCYLGRCASGYRCQPGNVCCEESGVIDSRRIGVAGNAITDRRRLRLI